METVFVSSNFDKKSFNEMNLKGNIVVIVGANNPIISILKREESISDKEIVTMYLKNISEVYNHTYNIVGVVYSTYFCE